MSGFLVDDVSQAIAATRRVAELDRTLPRAAFERRFAIGRVAREYAQIYRGLVSAEQVRREGHGRNGVARSLIPRSPRGYGPILVEAGA